MMLFLPTDSSRAGTDNIGIFLAKTRRYGKEVRFTLKSAQAEANQA
jgi:hypothetical protein